MCARYLPLVVHSILYQYPKKKKTAAKINAVVNIINNIINLQSNPLYEYCR